MLSAKRTQFGILRKAGLIALVIGAAGSVCVMLYSSRNSDQQFLKVLFTVWVLSPFLLLELGDIVSERWHLIARPSLYWTMVIVAVGSLAIYILAVLRSPEAIPTPVFVATPPISGLVIAAVAGIAGWISRRSVRG